MPASNERKMLSSNEALKELNPPEPLLTCLKDGTLHKILKKTFKRIIHTFYNQGYLVLMLNNLVFIYSLHNVIMVNNCI